MKKLSIISILLAIAFHASAYHWEVNPHQWAYSMTVAGVVAFDGVEQTTASLEVGAFCGDECRGREMPIYVPELDRYMLFLNLYGDEGDMLTFRIYDHNLGEELDLTCSSTMVFDGNGAFGTLMAPYVFDFLSSYAITAEANPEVGGTVSGAGIYVYGTTATLGATANEGYHFVNWTKDNEAVSTEASYSFTVTEALTFVANFELNSYEITAEANPTEGGTVAGAGIYNHFDTCTLTALANEGYHFLNWTLDSLVVSTDTILSFEVTGAASYVANFELNSYEITATANPEGGGTVSGAGTYDHFSTCTLTATANTGYHFVNWTEDGEEVSAEATYSFEVDGSADYVANFELNSYEITATANPIEGGTVAGAGVYNHFDTCTLTAMANEGYHFLGWTLDSLVVSTDTIFGFEVTGAADYVANFELTAITQTVTLSAGWNWWSGYIELDGANSLQDLEEALGTNGLMIKSQNNGYASYLAGYGWYGSLSGVHNESMYQMRVGISCTLELTGLAVHPADHPITLVTGWNWIGYPVTTSMSIEEALSGITPHTGDMLKSQNSGYASYLEGFGWYGSLSTLEPGMGLMYKSNNSQPVTFTFPTENGGGR